jgi:hypothetical protein
MILCRHIPFLIPSFRLPRIILIPSLRVGNFLSVQQIPFQAKPTLAPKPSKPLGSSTVPESKVDPPATLSSPRATSRFPIKFAAHQVRPVTKHSGGCVPSSWERVEKVGGRLVLLPWRDVEFKIAIGLSWGVGYNSLCYILLLLGIFD